MSKISPIYPRFSYGDRVKANGHAGTVKGVYVDKDANTYICKVEFDSPSLIPRVMEYKQEHLTCLNNNFSYKRAYNASTYCPICGNEWTYSKSPVLNTTWIDCTTCNMPKEKVLKRHNEELYD